MKILQFTSLVLLGSLLLGATSGHTLINKPLQMRHCGDPHRERNETIRLEMTQDFFDDIQQNLLIPFFLNIENLINLTINPISFAGDIGILNVSGNITQLYGNELNFSRDASLIGLHDGYITFNLSDLILDGAIGYEFITDPPIMADIGFLNITMDRFQLVFNTTTVVENYDL